MAAETPKIELIYDADCPNVGRARERLSQAVAERGQGLGWAEWRSDDPTRPAHARTAATLRNRTTNTTPTCTSNPRQREGTNWARNPGDRPDAARRPRARAVATKWRDLQEVGHAALATFG
jgi:hypothetical protein